MIKNLYFSIMLAIIFLGVGPAPAQPVKTRQSASTLKTVVIDPGHGGNDTGARGPAGTLEKEVCLNLARLLADALRPTFKVVLTRSDDYSVDNLQRTAMANHEKAVAFISLHTGAAFSHAAKGMAVYTYQPAGKIEDDPAHDENADPPPWQRLQLAHLTRSRALAAAIQARLTGLDRSATVQLQQGPLTVLQGADTPAVLVEVGQLSNPDTEKDLTSVDQLRSYARAMAGAIESYFSASS